MESEQEPKKVSEVPEQIPDKNIVDTYLFKKNNDVIVLYSAEWCKYCRQLKPELLEYLSSNNYVQIGDKSSITKDEYKSIEYRKFIPAITFNNNYLQSSKINEIISFINSNNFVLLDDF